LIDNAAQILDALPDSGLIALGLHVLISRLGRTGLVLVRLRAYSNDLTAASWKLWCRFASTAGTLLYDVSMNMACSWILNALVPLAGSQNLLCLHASSSRVGSTGDDLLERLAMESLARHFCQIDC
jgi:hypothetical protein